MTTNVSSGQGDTCVVRSGDGRTLLAGPLGAVLLAGQQRTGGAASFVMHSLAAHSLGSPVHTHQHEDEWSFVLEGELGVQVGQETIVVRSGDLVLKPRGVPHAFWNGAEAPARFLEVVTPSGFENYFSRLGEVLTASETPDMERLGAVATEYGLEVDPESIPRLAQQHGLRLP